MSNKPEISDTWLSKTANNQHVKGVMIITRDDGEPLVGGAPIEPSIVEVGRETSFSDAFQTCAEMQGEGVNLTVTNIADFSQEPTLYLEGQEAQDFVLTS